MKFYERLLIVFDSTLVVSKMQFRTQRREEYSPLSLGKAIHGSNKRLMTDANGFLNKLSSHKAIKFI